MVESTSTRRSQGRERRSICRGEHPPSAASPLPSCRPSHFACPLAYGLCNRERPPFHGPHAQGPPVDEPEDEEPPKMYLSCPSSFGLCACNAIAWQQPVSLVSNCIRMDIQCLWCFGPLPQNRAFDFLIIGCAAFAVYHPAAVYNKQEGVCTRGVSIPAHAFSCPCCMSGWEIAGDSATSASVGMRSTSAPRLLQVPRTCVSTGCNNSTR